jgi:hypothetical protein
MASVHERLTEQFREWELRGRGWKVFGEPVHPEPPFRPFLGHYLEDVPVLDDGRKPTILNAFIQTLSGRLRGPPTPPIPSEIEEEPEPKPLHRDSLVELQASLPSDLSISKEVFEQFFLNLSLCGEPIAFELIGAGPKIIPQFVVCTSDVPLVRRQAQAFFPDATFRSNQQTLEQVWNECEGDEVLVVEFGLAKEFMFPLASGKLDPFIGIIGALSELKPCEFGMYQVIFQGTQQPWTESITRSVTHDDGKPFFVNSPELADAAKAKVARPLYAAVVRIVVKTNERQRTQQMACDLAGSLRVFAEPQGNELIPLTNHNYSFDEHVQDALRRQSHRTGMLLNSDELIGFVHLPSSDVRSPGLQREVSKTKAAPAIIRRFKGVLLGNNIHAGENVPIRLDPEQRVRHTHIIGASGSGKSTLLFNLIRQDIENGEGVAVLDPHGDLVDRILGIIPSERVDDVVLVDPSDEQYSVGFNILSAHSELEQNLIASDLVSVFQRLSTSWGDQMGSVLNNAILAFLESTRRGTLVDLRRFLIEPAFRADFLKTVRDSNLIYYWQKGFPQLSGNKSIGSVITRLDTFLGRKPIRYMVSQQENRLDFSQIMDTGKIFLAKLSQGLLGKENSHLLGTLLVSKFQQLAMARQIQRAALRKEFWIYIDEFHNFITPTMAEILAGARKYRIGLILAHQELRQLQRDSEVASAVMSNAYTRICFRLGDEDARKLSDGFAFFEPRDLQNLGVGEAIARIERSNFDFNLAVPFPTEAVEDEAARRRLEVITASREKYSTHITELETAVPEFSKIEKPTAIDVEKGVAPDRSPRNAPPQQIAPPAYSVIVAAAEETKSLTDLVRKSHSSPTDLGRGGRQHQAIQKRIKDSAEALGFISVIEKPILDGKGSIDLFLQRNEENFACEVSISTSIDHEFGNVSKCLRAGFLNVAVVCLDDDRLRRIADAVAGSLGNEITKRVGYFQPDQFIAYLKTLPSRTPAEPIPPATSVRRGYKIKRLLPTLTSAEQKDREEAAIRSIAEAMRSKK